MDSGEEVKDAEIKPLRTRAEIAAAYRELWDRVWWHRHVRLGKPEAGRAVAERIERQYGLAALRMGFDHIALATGRLSALAWVLGTSWERSGDT
jgi:hypothetical protein